MTLTKPKIQSISIQLRDRQSNASKAFSVYDMSLDDCYNALVEYFKKNS